MGIANGTRWCGDLVAAAAADEAPGGVVVGSLQALRVSETGNESGWRLSPRSA